jgi:hypothetical protein
MRFILRALPLFTLFAVNLGINLGFPARGATPPLMWLDPAPESSDYLDLFRHPETWAEERHRINIFNFGPGHFKSRGQNTLNDLVSIDAFRKIRSWAFKTAISGGAVKGWDCEAHKTLTIIINKIKD